MGIFAAAVLGLALTTAFVALWLLDTERLKTTLETRFEQQTGHALSIDGGLSLTLIPNVGVELGHTSVAQPSEFGSRPLAEFELLTVPLELGALLGGELQPGVVTLVGLRLNLVRAPSGRLNLEALRPAGDPAGGASPAALTLGGLKVEDATLSYDDRQSGESLVISGLSARLGALEPDRSAPLSARFDFSAPTLDAEGGATVKAEVLVTRGAGEIRIGSLSANMALRGERIPGGEIVLKARGDARHLSAARRLTISDLDLEAEGQAIAALPARLKVPEATLDLASGAAALEAFTLEATELKAGGELRAQLFEPDRRLTGQIRVPSFRPRTLLVALGQSLPDAADAELPAEARLTATIAADSKSVMLQPMALDLGRSRIAGRVELGLSPEWPLTAALSLVTAEESESPGLEFALRGRGRKPAGGAIYEANEVVVELGPVTARADFALLGVDDGLRYRGSLELPSFDPRALLAHLSLPAPRTRDSKVLTRISAKAGVTGTGLDATVEPLMLRVDDTEITGTLRFSGGTGGRPALLFDLSADAIELQRYLPPPSPGAQRFEPPWPPSDLFGATDVAGRIRLKALRLGDLVLDNVEVVAKTQNGRLELRSDSAARPLAVKHPTPALLPAMRAP